MGHVTVVPGEQNKRTRGAGDAFRLHTDEATLRIRARLAAVANELRMAAEGSEGEKEKLLTLAERFDEEATSWGQL